MDPNRFDITAVARPEDAIRAEAEANLNGWVNGVIGELKKGSGPLTTEMLAVVLKEHIVGSLAPAALREVVDLYNLPNNVPGYSRALREAIRRIFTGEAVPVASDKVGATIEKTRGKVFGKKKGGGSSPRREREWKGWDLFDE